MNIVLFEPNELDKPLPLSDRRSQHVLGVLRRTAGDSFAAGIIDGPRGTAVIESVTEDGLCLRFQAQGEPPPLDPLVLLVGLPRPQTARKVLQEATSLGARELHFFLSELGERSYAHSPLWRSEWRRYVIAGAEQAYTTRLPLVDAGRRLPLVLAGLPASGARLALDNYEAEIALSEAPVQPPAVLAVGPERGWSADERDLLRRHGFRVVHLGERVLRVETACVAALAITRARLGLA